MVLTMRDRSWWRHQMETFSMLLALCAGNSPVTSEFPSQRPVTRSFDVFFDLRLNKRLSKQSRCRWFETSSRSLWRQCNVVTWFARGTEWSASTISMWSTDIKWKFTFHYGDVIMDAIAFQITSLTIVYSTVYSDVDQRKHESSASLAFVRGIHRRPVNSSHKRPVTRKMFQFDDVIMYIHFYKTVRGELHCGWNLI